MLAVVRDPRMLVVTAKQATTAALRLARIRSVAITTMANQRVALLVQLVRFPLGATQVIVLVVAQRCN